MLPGVACHATQQHIGEMCARCVSSILKSEYS